MRWNEVEAVNCVVANPFLDSPEPTGAVAGGGVTFSGDPSAFNSGIAYAYREL